jgi:hypothetical protein
MQVEDPEVLHASTLTLDSHLVQLFADTDPYTRSSPSIEM